MCCLKPIRIATSIVANLVQLLKYRRNWVRVLEIRFIQSEKKTAILHQNKFQKRANFQTWWSTSTMSVTSEKPRMLTIYRSNQSTKSDQKAILLNILPNEAILYTIDRQYALTNAVCSSISGFVTLLAEAAIASWCVHTLTSILTIVGILITFVHV